MYRNALLSSSNLTLSFVTNTDNQRRVLEPTFPNAKRERHLIIRSLSIRTYVGYIANVFSVQT
jgi:hypothetical protein